jgi:hypothetical protein
LPEFFNKEVPPEQFSDCADCPMICSSHDKTGEDVSRPFSPETKCCTFHPRLPAYLVGAVLTDDDPELDAGKQKMIEKIASQRGIFPHGVYPTKKIQAFI